MADLIAQVQKLAELIGPNVYLQAAIIAATFIVAGKIADWIISAGVHRWARRTESDLDDRLLAIMHRPLVVSVVLIGSPPTNFRLQGLM